MNSRKIFGYGLIAVKVMLAVLLALTAFSCDDANGNGTKVQTQQVTLPQGLQGKTYTESGGGSITFGSDSVTVTSSDGTSHTYKIKSQERSGNKTKLKFSDNAGKDYIVVSDNGTIEEVVFDEVSGEGEWTYSSGNNPNPNEPVLEEKVMIYFYDSDSDSGNTLWQWSFPFGSKVSLAQNVYYREPQKEGYDFTGWYTERNGDTLYDFDIVLTKENVPPEMQNIDGEIKQTGWCVKVYAVWKVHVYTFEEMIFKGVELNKEPNPDGKYNGNPSYSSGGTYIHEDDFLKIAPEEFVKYHPETSFFGIDWEGDLIKGLESYHFLYCSFLKPAYSNVHVGFTLRRYTYGDDVGNEFNDYLLENPVFMDDNRLPLNIVLQQIGFGYQKSDNISSPVLSSQSNPSSWNYNANGYNYVVTDSEGMYKVTGDVSLYVGEKSYESRSFMESISEQYDYWYSGYSAAWPDVQKEYKANELIITGYEFDYEKGTFLWIELGEHAYMKPGKYIGMKLEGKNKEYLYPDYEEVIYNYEY